MLFNNMLMASGALAAATTELAPTDSADTDFGRNATFSGDDSRLFVTSRQSVHVYTMSGATPTFEQRIVPGDGITLVNVSADSTGTRAAFGSGSDDEVYIYTRSGTTWSLEATLTDPNSSGDGYFGARATLSSDATVLAVYGGTDGTEVFTRSGTTWTHRASLPNTGITGISANAAQSSIAVSPDGGTIAIGFQADQDNSGTNNVGAVLVYKGSGSSWSLSQTLRASDKGTQDAFGGGVGFGGDNTLFIGASGWDASYTDGTNVGAVYEFSRTSSSASFIEQATMYPPESANYGGENFGFADASSNGLTVLGSKGASTTSYDVLVFRKTGGSWGLLKTLTLPTEWQGTSGSSDFGRYQYNAMNSSGSIYVVGAEDLDGGAGRAFIFS